MNDGGCRHGKGEWVSGEEKCSGIWLDLTTTTRERTRPCEAARGKPNFARGVHRRTIVSRTICWLTLGFTMRHDATDPIPWQERTTVGIRGLLGHVYATQAVHKSGWRQPLTDTCVGRSTTNVGLAHRPVTRRTETESPPKSTRIIHIITYNQ